MTDQNPTDEVVESLTALYEHYAQALKEDTERQEYLDWQEKYRELVFAKEIKVTDYEPVLSRRARRRRRNKDKQKG